MQQAGEFRFVNLQYTQDEKCCPLRTLHLVLQMSPTLTPKGPIFMFPQSRRPVPSSFVALELHRYLTELGFSHLIPSVSLHSIQKSKVSLQRDTSYHWQHLAWNSHLFSSWLSSPGLSLSHSRLRLSPVTLLSTLPPTIYMLLSYYLLFYLYYFYLCMSPQVERKYHVTVMLRKCFNSTTILIIYFKFLWKSLLLLYHKC